MSVPFESVGGILGHRGRDQPDSLAVRFLRDGGRGEQCWTYRELDAAARRVARRLRQEARPGDRALVLHPPGLDFVAAFFGCLYAGVIAVPASPLGRGRDSTRRRRLAGIIEDCRPRVALTSRAKIPPPGDEQGMRWVATDGDAAADDGAEASDGFSPGHDEVAFLQYTSGSTGTPRGVMVTHGNLLHNLGCIQECVGDLADAHSVTWLPPDHDMGLIGAILEPIYAGFPTTLLSPLDFLQRPLRWLQAITRLRGTGSAAPGFAYDLCVRRTTPEERASLDLHSWRVAFVGSEPINSAILERFAETFAPCGFRPETFLPSYGLGESTLMVSGRARRGAPRVAAFRGEDLGQGRAEPADPATAGARRLVACGSAVTGQEIVIVDPETRRRLGEGRVGEIWVAGPSVARGYWQRTEETEHTFGARLTEEADSRRYLRTGDLGFVHAGDLFVTGRLKDLIIVAGAKHHAEDIERTAEASHPALCPGAGAAFAVTVEGREALAIVYEVRGLASPEESRAAERAVTGAVAEEHGIIPAAILFLKSGAVPRTSSGKVRRHACRLAFLDGGFAS